MSLEERKGPGQRFTCKLMAEESIYKVSSSSYEYICNYSPGDVTCMIEHICVFVAVIWSLAHKEECVV